MSTAKIDRNRTSIFITVAILASLAISLFGEDIQFPAGSVIDVTQPPYNAVPDDGQDDTAAIQQALSDHWNRGAILYLPNGTYVISETLRWGTGPHGGHYMKNTILQGQSREGTIIRLVDHAKFFNGSDGIQPMLYTGKSPAQRFRNAVRNLTLHTGEGNKANGAWFYANNAGRFEAVILIDGGNGGVGLDLSGNENGPLLIKDVKIVGFDIGVKTANHVNSVTIEGLELEGQRQVGLQNSMNIVTVRNLISRNSVPAIENRAPMGVVTLVDSELIGMAGAADKPAIINAKGATLFARDVTTPGYGQAVDNRSGHGEDVAGHTITEFTSHPVASLFPTALRSLRLPIRQTPSVPWDDPATWVSPTQFGGSPNDDAPDSDAIQQAIDSGATTVYLDRAEPDEKGRNKGWRLDKPVHIRGNVRRIIGLEAVFYAAEPLANDPDASMWVFEDGEHPVVVMERMWKGYGKADCQVIQHNSSRTLVLKSVSHFNKYHNTEAGTGDLFVEDTASGQWRIGHNQKAWFRQVNAEDRDRTKIVARGSAQVWILGLKTEMSGDILHIEDEAAVEILGAHIYSNQDMTDSHMFVLGPNTKFSAAGVGESCWVDNRKIEELVVETRNDEQRILPILASFPKRAYGRAFPLYVGTPWIPEGPPPPPPTVKAETAAGGVVLHLESSQAVYLFHVRRNDRLIAQTQDDRFVDSNLEPQSQYRYSVVAVSESGEFSDPTNLTVTTEPDTAYQIRVQASDDTGNTSGWSQALEVRTATKSPDEWQIHAERANRFHRARNTGGVLGNLADGVWTRYDDVELGDPPFTHVTARMAATLDKAQLELWIGGLPGEDNEPDGGTKIGTFTFTKVGGWHDFDTFTIPVKIDEGGTQDLYIIFRQGEAGSHFGFGNLDWLRFDYGSDNE